METSEAGRRDFLRRAAIGGAALTIGPAVLPVRELIAPAVAQDAEPELADDDLAAFAESIELAAAQLHRQAAAGGEVASPAAVEASITFAAHHEEHARAFAATAGAKATHQPNPRLAQVAGDQIRDARDEAAVLRILFDLENAAASSHLFALGEFESPDAARLSASVMPVESQHAVALGSAMGLPLDRVIPEFETQDKRIDPAQFPVEA